MHLVRFGSSHVFSPSGLALDDFDPVGVFFDTGSEAVALDIEEQ